MNWFNNLWRHFSGAQLAIIEAENVRLAETNAALEEEIVSLRKENRTLTNTILGQAGVAPLPPAEEVKPVPRVRHLTVHQQRRVSAIQETRRDIEEAKELRKRFEDKNHPAVRSN